MCRQNQLWGCVLIAFGVGVLIGLSLKGGFLSASFAVGTIVLGFCITRRK